MKPKTPGQLLKDILLENNITQEKFAKHIGVTLGTVSSIISNKFRLTPKLATKIASSFNMSPEFWIKAQIAIDVWNIEQENCNLPASIFVT